MFHSPPYNQIVCRPIFRHFYFFQTVDPEPQHLSLTALFGKQDKSPCQETVGSPQTIQQLQRQEPLPMRQGVVRSLSYEEPRRHSPPIEKQLCPAIQKLMVRSADLHPLSELPENRPCRNGNTHSAGEVFLGPVQPGSPHSIGTSQRVQSASRTQSLLEKLQNAPRPAHKYDPSTPAPASSAAPNLSTALATATPGAPVKGLAQAQAGYFSASLPAPTLGHQACGKEPSAHPRPALPHSGSQTGSSGVISPQELLKKLQVVQQEQQLHAPNRPALAAKFPVVTQSSRAGQALESWMDKTAGTEKQTPLFQVDVFGGGWGSRGGIALVLQEYSASLRSASVLQGDLCTERGATSHIRTSYDPHNFTPGETILSLLSRLGAALLLEILYLSS